MAWLLLESCCMPDFELHPRFLKAAWLVMVVFGTGWGFRIAGAVVQILLGTAGALPDLNCSRSQWTWMMWLTWWCDWGILGGFPTKFPLMGVLMSYTLVTSKRYFTSLWHTWKELISPHIGIFWAFWVSWIGVPCMTTFWRLLRAGGFTVSGAAIWTSELHVTRVIRKFAKSAFGGSGNHRGTDRKTWAPSEASKT